MHKQTPPPFALDRESFNELKNLTILLILSDNPDGVTGYFLQKNYQIPRTSASRILEKLKDMGYVDIKLNIVKGRSNKLYIITRKGKNYLEKLKKKWAYKFAFFSDIAPEKLLNETIRRPFKSKEDALNHFRQLKAKIDKIILKIEKMKHFSTEKLQELLENYENE